MLEELSQALKDLHANMIRIRVDLMPANESGLVYPPTYDQGKHIFRPAWVDGEHRDAVLLDSVQSQANRIEEAILDAHRRGDINYPDIEITVGEGDEMEHYSILQLSHRIYDAALRATEIDGAAFPKHEIGEAVYKARADAATALFTHAPITLALGGWDSHSGGGPLVAKIPRLISSEIVGVDAEPVDRGAVKFDPMDIRKAAGPVYEAKDEKLLWTHDEKQRKPKGKKKDPSEIGLGNVPNFEQRGATISCAIQTSVVSLTATRRLRFQNENGEYDNARDEAGRNAVAALALYGLIAQMELGYDLRSGCELIPKENPTVEVIGASLAEKHTVSLDAAGARQWLEHSLGVADAAGLAWRKEALKAKADARLDEMIKRSREAGRESE